MILAPNGRTLAKRGILAMSPRQVTWFIDPEALLRHLGDLHVLHMAACCQHCFDHGLPEDVSAVFSPDKRQWILQCACADYPPVIDRGDGKLQIRKPQDDGTTTIHDISSVDELLVLLGWTFKCTDCPKHGMEDGIEGENDPQTQVLQVSCGCTVRAYRDGSVN